MVVFPAIFVTDTKINNGHNFVAPLTEFKKNIPSLKLGKRYHTSNPGLIPRRVHVSRSPKFWPTEPFILPRSKNELRELLRLTLGHPRWGLRLSTTTGWYNHPLGTYHPRSVCHIHVDWSTEPYGSDWLVSLVSFLICVTAITRR